MEQLFPILGYWTWLVAAGVLLILELTAPGVFFIWLGAAAALTGVIALVIPGLGWEIEALLFALLAVLSIVGWRSYQKKTAKNEVPSTLNRRGEQMIGRTAVLSEPIQNTAGMAI